MKNGDTFELEAGASEREYVSLEEERSDVSRNFVRLFKSLSNESLSIPEK